MYYSTVNEAGVSDFSPDLLLCIFHFEEKDSDVLLNNIIKKKLVERAKVGHGSL
jgi:hypothetical protein